MIGFLLVLFAIRNDRGFWWLIRSQLVALVLTIIIYTVVPVDFIVHRYNVTQIRGGHLHPAVMIAVKSIDDEGILPVLELTDCEDPIIRDGVLAMLAQRQIAMVQPTTEYRTRRIRDSVRVTEIPSSQDSSTERHRRPHHWSKFQGSTYMLGRRLAREQVKWADFQDPGVRANALKAFKAYSMQWY